MIDTDDFVEHTGSCNNNCNGCYDDMAKLLAEVKRLREGIKSYLDLEIDTHELKEMVE